MSGPNTVTPPKKESQATGIDKRRLSSHSAKDDVIREQAYYKWEAAGCPCCDGVEYWLMAEAEASD